MRDLLYDIESTLHLSDPDPVKRAQIQMRTPAPKRFYTQVSVEERPEGHVVLLDGKPVRTPGRTLMALPVAAAAQCVADEFAAQGETMALVSMPAYRLVNSAIDGVAQDPQAVLQDILRYAGTDLLCYRAGHPDELVARQAQAWDPVLDWARTALGARLILAEGVMHVEQPAQSIERIGAHLQRRAEPLRLAALHVMTGLMGSALLAIAVDAQALEPEAAWAAAHVDEDFQAEQWGHDAEAVARAAQRRRDMMAAASLSRLLGAPAG